MGISFVYNSGSREDDRPEDELHINFGVFIDGTLNNMYNTDHRTAFSRGGKNNPNKWDLTNTAIEKLEDEQYNNIPNRAKIEKLLEIEKRTAEQQALLDKMPKKDVYLVASHRGIQDKMGTDNSYSNDYTNVARMWTCCDEEYKIYIEGMGTKELNRDDDEGFQFGSGSISGIRARVREACEKVVDNIKKQKDNKENHGKKLKVITLDVFGFSRGAAAARNFVAELNLNEGIYPAKKVAEYEEPKKEKPIAVIVKDGIQTIKKIDVNPYATVSLKGLKIEPFPKKVMHSIYEDLDGQLVNGNYIIKGNMPKRGQLGISLLEKGVIQSIEELNEIDVIIRFLGIYDTVSSYEEIGPLGGDNTFIKGISHLAKSYFTDDEKQLNLQNMGPIQKIVHFTAKDEHRENFALTRVTKKYSKEEEDGSNRLIERNFPGVHCDIGGAYLNEPEVIDEIETTAFLTLKVAKTASAELAYLRKELIRAHWFYDNEIKITKPLWYYPAKVIEVFSNISYNFKTAYLARQAAYEALSSERNIKKEYSYIPLHFMAEYCEPLITTKYMPQSKNVLNNYSISGHSVLEQTKSYLKKHVLQDNKEWDFISDKELMTHEEIMNLSRVVPPKTVIESTAQHRVKFDFEKQKDFEKNQKLKENKEIGAKFDPQDKIVQKEEINYNSQELLRKLRHEYFHWSSNRDWFGMDHATDRIRVEYPRK
ncbi:phospholipase effector Tle1 domain-containing protein [Flavobacterium ardleyense]|uniref:Phospholipase effector Tle1 domain-containing protein n=1 Tax=Flavobacterium ardleyense TaxID=2038737 RepID=A0ABW5ZAI2_9FLAO